MMIRRPGSSSVAGAEAKMAGTRYAKLLPTPVPASTTRCPGFSMAAATAAAMASCWLRFS